MIYRLDVDERKRNIISIVYGESWTPKASPFLRMASGKLLIAGFRVKGFDGSLGRKRHRSAKPDEHLVRRRKCRTTTTKWWHFSHSGNELSERTFGTNFRNELFGTNFRNELFGTNFRNELSERTFEPSRQRRFFGWTTTTTTTLHRMP